MPVSYTPAAPSINTDQNDNTVGATSKNSPNPDGTWPQFNVVGWFADAGEVADCLNKLVTRIRVLENLQGITGN